MAIVDEDPRRLRLVKAILVEAGYATQRQARRGNGRRGQGTVVLAHDSCAEKFDEVLAQCVETLHPLVLYSESPSTACVVERMSRGAAGYLDWPISGEDAVQAIELARRVGAKTMTLLNEERQALKLIARLTRREKEVLGYLAAGLTTKQMAEQMGLSQRTVDIFRSRLVNKIGSNRATAFKVGFISWLGQQ